MRTEKVVSFDNRSNCWRDQTSAQRQHPIRPMDNGLFGYRDWRLHDVFGPVQFSVHVGIDSARRCRCHFTGTRLPTDPRIEYGNNNDERHSSSGGVTRTAALHASDLLMPLLLQLDGHSTLLPCAVHSIPNPHGQVPRRDDGKVSLVLYCLFDPHVFRSTRHRVGPLGGWHHHAHRRPCSNRHYNDHSGRRLVFTTQKANATTGYFAQLEMASIMDEIAGAVGQTHLALYLLQRIERIVPRINLWHFESGIWIVRCCDPLFWMPLLPTHTYIHL